MKTAIAVLALFAVAANAAVIEPRGNHDTIITIHKVSKEIKELVDLFDQCQSYESDALKGTCFTKFSLRLANDIKAIVEHIQNNHARSEGWDLTKEISVLLIKVKNEVENLINIAHECESYDSESRRATCWTRFSLQLASDIANLSNAIYEIVNNSNSEDVVAFSQANAAVVEPHGNHDTIITIHKVSKEIKELVDLFDQCQSYESDALKGTCFTKFSLRLANDIKAIVEHIQNNKARSGGWELTEEISVLLIKVKNEVKNLINIAHECESYDSESRRATCWTRFSLQLASDIANLSNAIYEIVNNSNSEDVVAFSQANAAVVEPHGNHDTVITIHKVSKEIKELVNLFNQCQSYESDALKGTCFTKFTLRLANDIKDLVEHIQNNKARSEGWDLTKEITVLLYKVEQEVENLINIAHECESYENESRRATCWTRFSLQLASDVANLTNAIYELVNSSNSEDVVAFKQMHDNAVPA